MIGEDTLGCRIMGACANTFGRFHFVYKFLDLPYQDVALLPVGEAQQKRSDSKL